MSQLFQPDSDSTVASMVCDKSKNVCHQVENHAQEPRFNTKYIVRLGLLVHQAYDKVIGHLFSVA